MELFIFILIAQTVASSTVQEECEKCIAKPDHAFYKIIWSVSAPTEYVCRSNANLISKFGYVVDSACDQESCGNLSTRPLLRHGRRYGYFDCKLQDTVETSNHHARIVAVVRDYLEIFLMSIVCAILVLKKRILLECINSHRSRNNNTDNMSDIYEATTEEGIDETGWRKQQATDKDSSPPSHQLRESAV